MLKILIYALLTILALGCETGTRTFDISDITKSETIILEKDPGQGTIYSLTVNGEGRIEGKAEIALILNGDPYKTERLSGTVDFQWGGDWYSDQAEIRYSPKSTTGGSLRLRYKFNGLK